MLSRKVNLTATKISRRGLLPNLDALLEGHANLKVRIMVHAIMRWFNIGRFVLGHFRCNVSR